MKNLIVFAWDFIFDHEKSPLRHIPDFNVRHMVFQLLGWMWAIAFSLAISGYTFLAWSLLAHAVLIAAAAVTVATYATSTLRPDVIVKTVGRAER